MYTDLNLLPGKAFGKKIDKLLVLVINLVLKLN